MIPRNVILCGDVREKLRELPDESIHTCITSPPYWSLRDYGVEPTIWGGEPGCEHSWSGVMRQDERYTGKKRWQHLANGRDEFQPDVAEALGRDGEGKRLTVRDLDPNAWGHPMVEDTQLCSRCGAWRGALGLEPTPEMYVEHIVTVMREVRRVLRRDGTLWLNLGDSYAAGGKGGGGSYMDERREAAWQKRSELNGWRSAPPGLKPKDLCGVPWRVALALQADGWWLRSDIIWSKPNPMPESVRDRPTRAHEYLFLLSRSASYYYDQDAIREPLSAGTIERYGYAFGGSKNEEQRDGDQAFYANRTRVVGELAVPAGRNRRSVWEIPTEPFPEAHFATFPTELVKPCILAGTSEHGCCSECGAPWERVTEKGLTAHDGETASAYENGTTANRLAMLRQAARSRGGEYANATTTTGWRPTCTHGTYSCTCGIVLEYGQHRNNGGQGLSQGTVHSEGLSRVRDGLRDTAVGGAQAQEDVVHAELSRPLAGADSQDNHGALPDDGRLHSALSSGPSDGDAGGIRLRTSIGGSRDDRPAATGERSGQPQKRNQERQQTRELGSDAEGSARQLWMDGPALASEVPVLWRVVSPPRQCPSCNGTLAFTPSPTQPSLVLDIFMGSGTVALVALRAARDYIGIELSPAYVAMAEERIGMLKNQGRLL